MWFGGLVPVAPITITGPVTVIIPVVISVMAVGIPIGALDLTAIQIAVSIAVGAVKTALDCLFGFLARDPAVAVAVEAMKVAGVDEHVPAFVAIGVIAAVEIANANHETVTVVTNAFPTDMARILLGAANLPVAENVVAISVEAIKGSHDFSDSFFAGEVVVIPVVVRVSCDSWCSNGRG